MPFSKLLSENFTTVENKAGRNQKAEIPHKAQGNNFLLAIGIDVYQHCPPLRNCVKDVQDFISVLQQRFNFNATYTYTLFNTEATRKNILKTFRDVQVRIQPQDNLVVYFSGHGDTLHQLGYWIPVEAKPGEEDEYISANEIVERLNAISSFHTFLIVDACFSGSLFQTTKNVSIPKRSDEVYRSRWGLTASHSRELALDGTAGDNSPFAECLLMRLRQTPEALSVHDLSNFVINEVRRRTHDTQTPIAQPLPVRGHELGQFVFHLQKDENQDWTAAKQENTLAAYERFLQSFPTGTHADEARGLMGALQDEAAWQQAKAKHTIIAYENYLSAFPQGHYRRQAMDAQRDIEEAEAWQRATRRNAIPAYREFQDNYPNSKHYNEATERIQQLLVRAAITTKEDTPIIIPKPEPKPVVIQPPPSKKTTTYKPYYFAVASFLLLVVVVVWIWSVSNNNGQVADTNTQETTDSITNKQQVDTPKTTPNKPAISDEKEVETPTNTGRTTDPSKQETKTNTPTKQPETKKEETKTPPKTEPKQEGPPPPTIDRARIKKLTTDAIQLLQFEETVEDAKKKLQEVLRLDKNNAFAKDALRLIGFDDIEGAIAVLKKAQ